MAKLYRGLMTDDTRSLFVPDIKNIKRLSDLSQPAIRPLVVTENAIVPYSYDVGACTTQPDFFLRFRSYISTISFCTISEPDWWPYESMLLMADMLFYFINCRPDGKKPSMECLLSTFLAMFGDYATSLQNDGRSLEAYFKERSAWTHLWKESISSFDSDGGTKTLVLLRPSRPTLPICAT